MKGRETSIVCFSSAPQMVGGQTCNPGMCPDQNPTGGLLLCGTTPSQLSHTGQGCPAFLLAHPEFKNPPTFCFRGVEVSFSPLLQ